MRELIDVNFQDKTSYATPAGGDIGGIVIDAPWGPVGKIMTCDLNRFRTYFPMSKNSAISVSQLTAFRALTSGMSYIEVVRLIGAATWKGFVVSPAGTAVPVVPAASTKTSLEGGTDLFIGLKYAGVLPEALNPNNSDFKITVSLDYEIPLDLTSLLTVSVELSYTDNSSGVATTVVLETVRGGVILGQVIDGQNYFLGEKLNGSKYFTGEALTASFAPVAGEVDLTFAVPEAITTADLTDEYSKYFSDIENSNVTILIDPGCSGDTAATDANKLISVAQTRTDCTALIGYPTDMSWTASSDTPTDKTVEAYKASLTPSMMAAFYACRELVSLYGRSYSLNGIGTIAGRYSYVASQESVNQLPSSKSWGAFGGVVSKSFPFTQVLDLHTKGINSVYNTSTGARIFGLRSLHPRESSYFSRFNVGRVCARLLKYAFGVAIDVIHTGNTDSKKSLVQNLLNADLNRLKSQGALRIETKVVCDPGNNLDVDTMGGKILKIDYECYFVSLIEKVSISITATDSSVSAKIS